MEPPTQAPYREYGQVDTCTRGGEGRQRGSGGGKGGGGGGGRRSEGDGRESWIKKLANWGSKRQSLKANFTGSHPPAPGRDRRPFNLERRFVAFIPLLVA